jgi:hypothetical protein
MDSTFGTRLRLQREEQQIPLATIAEKTKIKLSLLEGLERDDVSRWPTGLFRRSYFRAYATAIGLDADRMLREFQAVYPDPHAGEDITQVLSQAQHVNGYPRRPPTRLRCLINSAVSALPGLYNQQNVRSETGAQKTPTPPQAAPDAEVSRSPLPPAHERHAQPDVDFQAVAHLCTRLACALDICEVTPVLEEATKALHALGVVLWLRDRAGFELTPVIAHGYPVEMTTQLGRVPRDSDNAIARAFRTAEARVVDGSDVATGAVVVPLLTVGGCAGVLALELRHGGERLECVRAAAMILAAQLSTLIEVPVMAEAVSA